MYQQVLYQATDKLNNTLQNNKAGPLEVVLFLAAIGAVIGSAYMIRKELKEAKQEAEMRKYKTT
jgi:uncharacterized membrane protein YqgA involved in biofilm formation